MAIAVPPELVRRGGNRVKWSGMWNGVPRVQQGLGFNLEPKALLKVRMVVDVVNGW